MKILATYNIKGGVGKTSTAVNLSYLAARDGLRVLLADLDPQAAATYLLRVRPRVKGGGKALIQGSRELDAAIKGTDFDGLDLLPADFTFRNLDLLLDATKKPTQRLARLLRPLAGLRPGFLDCPPGISLLSEAVLHAADLVLAPIIPTTLSLRTLDQLTEFISGLDGHRPEVLAFCSMIDRRKRLHKEIAERLPAERKDVAAHRDSRPVDDRADGRKAGPGNGVRPAQCGRPWLRRALGRGAGPGRPTGAAQQMGPGGPPAGAAARPPPGVARESHSGFIAEYLASTPDGRAC